MITTISIDEAQATFKDLVTGLAPGEEVEIVENHRTVAKLIGGRPTRPPRPEPGLGKGSVLYIAPNFDAPMEEFQEYTG
jgi:antitoxin (DNA-binding transcriptional repressor) of toxin-antitoxin stability system